MHIYGICSSTSHFCSEMRFSTIGSRFNKIYDNIPEFWCLAEPTNISQTSFPSQSVGLYQIFRVRLRLRWCIQDQSHPSSPCMAGVGIPPCFPDPAFLADVGPQAKGWDLLWLTIEGSQEHRAAHALCRGFMGPWGSKAGEVVLPLMQPLQLRASCNWLWRAAGAQGFQQIDRTSGNKAYGFIWVRAIYATKTSFTLKVCK